MSNTHTKITLFDIPTALPGARPVSPFTSRVRYVLNYKGLAYKTEWVNLHEIEPFCKKHGYKPTGICADGSPHYTLPVLVDETSGSPISISDSLPIVEYLEATYPDPTRPIFPSSDPNHSAPALYVLAEAYARTTLVGKIFPVVMQGVHDRTLLDESREHWRRVILGGKRVEDVVPKKGSEGYNSLLNGAKDAFKTLAEFFEHNKGGVWILGDKPTFFDFALLSVFMLVKSASPEVWKEIDEACGGRWEKFIANGEVYLKY